MLDVVVQSFCGVAKAFGTVQPWRGGGQFWNGAAVEQGRWRSPRRKTIGVRPTLSG